MLDTIPSPNLQVLFDPVNLLSKDNWQEQDRVIRESFDLFGDRIVIVHAKDFELEAGAPKPEVIGRGRFDFALLASLLKARKSCIDVLLEETTPATIDESVAHLKRVFA